MKTGWRDAPPLMLQDLAKAISITRSKISYSLIEPQPLLYTPACGYKFHALAVHPLPIFTAPPVKSAFGIQSEVCARAFLRKQSTCYDRWLFLCRSSISLMFNGILNMALSEQIASVTGVTQGEIFNSSCGLILLIHTKHKYKNVKSWTDPTCSFS